MASDELNPVPPRPQVTLLRFGLRRMFVYVGLLCVLLATVSAAEGPAAVALSVVTLVVAAHVLSTFVGTRLRDSATEVARWEAAHGLRNGEPLLAVDQPRNTHRGQQLPAARQLRQRGSVVRRLWWLVAAGVLTGAGGGLGLMVAAFWPRIGAAAMAAGSLAAAILGGWIAFLASSFFGVTRRAWREAADAAAHRPAALQIASGNKATDRSWGACRK